MSTKDIRYYKEEIDQEIASYCESLRDHVEKEYEVYGRDALDIFIALLTRGGKRMRGALVMVAYEMFGGIDEKMIVQAARAMEMFQAYLLISDDVADRSTLRRGGPTAHILFEQYYDDRHLHGDKVHFGQSMAMIDSLLGAHLAETTISGLNGDPERKVRAVQNLHRNLLHTVFGQLRDILDEARDGVSEEDSLTVTRLKTAYYTFISPLQFGAILAGASDKDTEYLAEFGLHAGIAFQIVDDILGTFGNEEDLGKSVSSDILEGKMTLLTIYALAHAIPEDQKILEAALGNQTITAETLAECQQILVRTGGLDHAQEVARLELAKARKVLKGAPKSWSKDGREFLESTLLQVEQGITIQH